MKVSRKALAAALKEWKPGSPCPVCGATEGKGGRPISRSHISGHARKRVTKLARRDKGRRSTPARAGAKASSTAQGEMVPIGKTGFSLLVAHEGGGFRLYLVQKIDFWIKG